MRPMAGAAVLLLPLLAGCMAEPAGVAGETPLEAAAPLPWLGAVPSPPAEHEGSAAPEAAATIPDRESLAGTVTAPDGSPIRNATVRYAPGASDRVSWAAYREALGNLTNLTAQTDANGSFELPLVVGLHRLAIRNDSFLPRFVDLPGAGPLSIVLTPHPGPRIVAHRGASAVAPENTMAAFREAILAGADALELDVRTTADGKLVVLHDAELSRTTDGKGLVAAHTLAEIQALDAGSWFDPSFAGERVPALREVLQMAREEGIRLVLDVKGAYRDNTTDPVYHESTVVEQARLEVAAAGLGFRQVLYTTFDPTDAQRCHLFSAIHCGWVVDKDFAFADEALLLQLNGLEAILLHHSQVNATSMQEIRSTAPSIKVFAYTVEKPKRMDELIALGVDGIVANDPARLFERVAASAPAA